MRYRPQIQQSSLRLHTVLCVVLVGSISDDDGDGYENVTEKVISHCPKLTPSRLIRQMLARVRPH